MLCSSDLITCIYRENNCSLWTVWDVYWKLWGTIMLFQTYFLYNKEIRKKREN